MTRGTTLRDRLRPGAATPNDSAVAPAVEDAIDTLIASPLALDALTAIAGVHPTRLLRTFRRYHGATISNYVRQRRVEHARTEIGKGNRPLSAIALEAGFADQSHFTRVFRQSFGETPGQHARSLRGRMHSRCKSNDLVDAAIDT